MKCKHLSVTFEEQQTAGQPVPQIRNTKCANAVCGKSLRKAQKVLQQYYNRNKLAPVFYVHE